MVSGERPGEYKELKRMEIFEFFGILKIYEDNQDRIIANMNNDEYSNARPKRRR